MHPRRFIRTTLGATALLFATPVWADEVPPETHPEPAQETPAEDSEAAESGYAATDDPEGEDTPQVIAPVIEEARTRGEQQAEALDALDALLEETAETGDLGGWADPMAEKPKSYPYLEHHGYFRFRTNLFYNGHLSTVVPGEAGSGTSGIPAPITENAANNSDPAISALVGTEDAKTIGGANIRLRYSPTLHISESLRVHATVDMLDNLVLGSTPDFAGTGRRPDVPLVAFAQSQAPPTAGLNGFRDSVRVKEAYGEWQPSFLVRVGRQATTWGLGILANAGDQYNDDFGDYNDRALIALKLYDVYITAAWDYLYSGAVTSDRDQPFGQPKDLGTADDGNQYTLALFQRPLSPQEIEKRRVDLYERFKPQFDWGVYTVYRTQAFDLEDRFGRDLIHQSGGLPEYDSLSLVKRDAWAVIPDIWFRYQQRFNDHSGLRVELELTSVQGAIGDTAYETTPGAPASPRTIEQYGGAMEIQYDWNQLSLGFDTGFATGDDAKGFGVLDRNTLANPDGTPNVDITAFKFDRDYRIDLMLFREVIGTVTNAVYFKPWAAYDFFSSPSEKFGLRLDLLYAQALEPEATPGNDPFLGFETDLRLFYHTASGFLFDIDAGLLLPGGAFNYRPADAELHRDAKLAFTVQGRMTWFY